MYYFRIMTVTLLTLPFFSKAQDSTTVRDFELWTGVTVKKSFLDNKLDLALTEEFRFHDNAGSINNYFTEFETSYKFYKGFDISAGLRYIKNNRKAGYETLGRFYTDLTYKHKIDRLSLSYRFRYQRQGQIGDSKVADEFPYSKYRLRFKAEYNIKKWKLDPYFTTEVFYTTTQNQINYISTITEPVNRVNGFEKVRFTIGTDYKINKFMEAGAFYRIEQEMSGFPLFYNTPATYYIAGLHLTFKL